MYNFDKNKIKEQLTNEQIFQLLEDFGADPEYGNGYILCHTICHNEAGVGSKKLYYYFNSQLFQCFTNCGSFDIFELTRKVFDIQQGRQIDLNDAIRFVAGKFGIAGEYEEIDLNLPADWKLFDTYERVQEVELKDYNVELKEYDNSILNRLNYNIIIKPWLDEGMIQEALNKAQIGYYPGADQITIPHFDKDGRFIGLRGRAMAQDDAEKWGKYRPIKILDQRYNHPLGMNLYGLNWAKDNIKTLGKAIIFESEGIIALVHFSRQPAGVNQ